MGLMGLMGGMGVMGLMGLMGSIGSIGRFLNPFSIPFQSVFNPFSIQLQLRIRSLDASRSSRHFFSLQSDKTGRID